MSILGQCGNQVGQELFSVLISDSLEAQRQCRGEPGRAYRDCSLERFFREHNEASYARAVLVDMEPKVITHAVATAAKSSTWKYEDGSYFCQKQGSGNNWANGFCVHGPRHEEAVSDLIRRQVERCDRLAGILTMMSVAGGTGSGMGTYITQCLRDSYPHSFILNQLTWPYVPSTEAVIVQNYNSVLTLSHLYQWSDAILVHENDTVHKICAKLMNIKHISFCDVRVPLNGQPALERMAEKTKQGFNKSLANVLILRGKDVSGADPEAFLHPGLYSSWLPAGTAFSTWRSPVPFNGYEKSATLVSNSQSLLKPLDDIVGKAWNMFASKAYVHQYTKFGISEEDFLDSFTALEQVISSYRHLAYFHQYTKFGSSEEGFLDSFTTLEQVISSHRHLPRCRKQYGSSSEQIHTVRRGRVTNLTE
ncbi:tubulin delta chain-like, partial [Scleropages formosus]